MPSANFLKFWRKVFLSTGALTAMFGSFYSTTPETVSPFLDRFEFAKSYSGTSRFALQSARLHTVLPVVPPDLPGI
ncbi:uncharacterized protein BDW70DRAFT_131177 [Aspergillus foveolatus]|uniref:uncharacterized protein n=1 Tax=Aspergillus foveolatus TaxID=210207 RepID=UPI003CCD2B48